MVNHIASGGIAVGMAGSKARYKNSEQVCINCFREHTNKEKEYVLVAIYETTICDCCETDCEEVYKIREKEKKIGN